MNNKIVSIKKTSAIFLAIVLVVGTFAVISPSFITGVKAQSQTYYGMDKDRKDISSLKCNNINVNVNGLELDGLPSFLGGEFVDEAQESTTDASSFAGNGADGSKVNDFRFICINNNNNTVIEVEEPPVPPTPPTTASLTVKKQVFGCTPGASAMFCPFDPNSSEWLDCDNSSISDSQFCLDLPENLFDIQVLDDQNALIQQFEGSEQGTTIPNLQPGIYTVEEIKTATNVVVPNQLLVNPESEQDCVFAGFTDGGSLFTTNVRYPTICFEYVDEQGNDCSTIALAAGEEKTCIVKNYIRFADPAPN